MKIEIGNKEFELRFGIKFIDALDKIYAITEKKSGVEFGAGLMMLGAQIEMKNPLAVFNTIKCALSHLNSKPSYADLEAFVESEYVKDEGVSLLEELKSELGKHPFTAPTFKKMKTAVDVIEPETV